MIAASPASKQIRTSWRRQVAAMARKYTSKVTLLLTVVCGRPSNTKMNKAKLTNVTPRRLLARPSQWR